MIEKPIEFRFCDEALAVSREAFYARVKSATTIGEAYRVDLLKRDSELYSLEGYKVPLDILGSELVEIDWVTFDYPNHQFETCVRLYRGGSPYVPDSDYDQGIDSNSYAIVCSDDVPPSIFPCAASSMGFHARDDRPITFNVLSEYELTRDLVRPLKAETCEAVLSALGGVANYIEFDLFLMHDTYEPDELNN